MMVTFKYHYTYGEIGKCIIIFSMLSTIFISLFFFTWNFWKFNCMYRFWHKLQGCYSHAKDLYTIISKHLKQHFLVVFKHLESVLQQEEIKKEDEMRLSNNLFTCISITQNYNCNIHVDADNVLYGFFIWFNAHG